MEVPNKKEGTKMKSHWIRTSGHVRVPTTVGGGSIETALLVIGGIVLFVILMIILIKVLDK